MTRRVVVSLSGGMDSTAVLAEALDRGYDVLAVGFTYGSKHNTYENAAAINVAEHYNVPFTLIPLTAVARHLKSNLLIDGGDIPEGHYEEETMSQTVVPGRNMIFASILAGIAWSNDADSVWMGVHSGDHAIYPDCRPDFVDAMNEAMQLGTDERIHLETPFLHANKTSVIDGCDRYNVPWHLTRTCYKDQPIACGKCGSCQERLEAFAANSIEDPIGYETREIMQKGS